MISRLASGRTAVLPYGGIPIASASCGGSNEKSLCARGRSFRPDQYAAGSRSEPRYSLPAHHHRRAEPASAQWRTLQCDCQPSTVSVGLGQTCYDLNACYRGVAWPRHHCFPRAIEIQGHSRFGEHISHRQRLQHRRRTVGDPPNQLGKLGHDHRLHEVREQPARELLLLE